MKVENSAMFAVVLLSVAAKKIHMRARYMKSKWSLLHLLTLTSACAGPVEGSAVSSSPLSGIDLSDPEETDATGHSNTTTGPNGSGGASTTGEVDDLPTSTCETLKLQGESVIKPVDIIFAIDTSGSMAEETAAVVANMNLFSSQIVASGADARVILIAASSMCIAPPLGSGQCGGGDDNLDRFLHIDQTVGSTNALRLILDTADQWQPHLRPEAATHVVVVSDDDSAMTPLEFGSKFPALLPKPGAYTFHAIVSAIDPDTSECKTDPACCNLTADKGTAYLQLIAKTGGVFGDLCDQDFAPVFAALAAHIVETAPVSCTWALPPSGDTAYDYAGASVDFALDGQQYSEMMQVVAVGACPQGASAWYYDDPQAPSQIFACPWACDLLTKTPTASVSIDLPCLPPAVG